ncbi:ATP phosphoribosyltransferase [Actinomadura terrae]|uniref:ATP phosphoribosyltransferase n=1 Tax=Actinomadura terrae TaxID=604353 RepID=UPI001FA6BE2B|nr:hypothetical protein [Actinomadura terrae]
MLSVVLPDGAARKPALDLFAAAGLTVRRPSRRALRGKVDDPRVDQVYILPAPQIPRYLERGRFDLGITGRDRGHRTAVSVISLGELCLPGPPSDLVAPMELLASRRAHRDTVKRSAMDDLMTLLSGAVHAGRKTLLKVRVPEARLVAVTEILAALTRPTSVPLLGGGEHAVEAVVDRRDISVLVPALKRAGAISIMEIPTR